MVTTGAAATTAGAGVGAATAIGAGATTTTGAGAAAATGAGVATATGAGVVTTTGAGAAIAVFLSKFSFSAKSCNISFLTFFVSDVFFSGTFLIKSS